MFKLFLKWHEISDDLEFLPLKDGYWLTLKHKELESDNWIISLVLHRPNKAQQILLSQQEPAKNVLEAIDKYKSYAHLVVKSL